MSREVLVVESNVSVLGQSFNIYGDFENPLFLAKDVSEWIEYSEGNTSHMCSMLDKEEVKKIFCSINGTKPTESMAEANRLFITEDGLYEVLMQSRKPIAKEFKKQVKEILKTVRKTGGYVVENRAIDFVSNWLPNLDDMSKTVIAGMLEDNQKLRLENSKQKEVIEVQVKEIEYKEDVIIGLVDEITLEEKRQTLNKVVKHKGANYSERWSLLYKHFQDKYHLDLKIRRANWDKVNKPKSKSMVDFIDRGLNKVPELYEIACKLFHSDIEEIVQHYKNLR